MNEAILFLARRITASASPGKDATGGHVESLTEAVMGVTAGLVAIASAIERLAEAAERIASTQGG